MADEIQDDGPPPPPRQPYRLTGSATKSTNATPSNTGPKATTALDRGSKPNPSANNSNPGSGVQQPKPQALPKRTGPASIIVSPRQKGNPILNHVKSLPWEYGDIPADYLLGLTTCCLFLSLKYHRLHPEYIYTRIKALQGKYHLRLILCMVDITNHEESLRELSKTSLINQVTLILCWSAAEGGRYLELFKTYENASPAAIRQHQSAAYSDRLVEFVTTPRAVNKTDAVALVSQFGTLRTAVNARYEDVATIAGWGDKKVKGWCRSVREPFRIQRAAGRKGIGMKEREETLMSLSQPVSREGTLSRGVTREEGVDEDGEGIVEGEQSTVSGNNDADARPPARIAERVPFMMEDEDDGKADDEEAMAEAMTAPAIPPKRMVEKPDATTAPPARKRKKSDEEVGEGVMAALSKLRKDG
ncbi:hypothetical protein NU219Hw_g2603t1 [Hortaea werneckii]